MCHLDWSHVQLYTVNCQLKLYITASIFRYPCVVQRRYFDGGPLVGAFFVTCLGGFGRKFRSGPETQLIVLLYCFLNIFSPKSAVTVTFLVRFWRGFSCFTVGNVRLGVSCCRDWPLWTVAFRLLAGPPFRHMGPGTTIRSWPSMRHLVSWSSSCCIWISSAFVVAAHTFVSRFELFLLALRVVFSSTAICAFIVELFERLQHWTFSGFSTRFFSVFAVAICCF